MLVSVALVLLVALASVAVLVAGTMLFLTSVNEPVFGGVGG